MSINEILAGIKHDLERVEEQIVLHLNTEIPLLNDVGRYILDSGGKRLRPAILIISAGMFDFQGEAVHKAAAAIEFLHTATLLHDDVVDKSDLRRGLATANAVWGNQASVLVGDFLLSRSFELMVEDGSLEVLSILSRTSAMIAEGEVMQLITTNDTETSETAYLEVITAKTAQLFAAACRIGAVVAGRPGVEEEALESYGLNLGIAFQLIDDVLDYSARQATLGKAVGDDFKEGKITLPVVLAFRRGDEDDRVFWRRTLEDLDQRPGDLEQAIELMEKHSALTDTAERARHYGAIARDAMGIFAEGAEKRVLLDLIDFCIARVY